MASPLFDTKVLFNIKNEQFLLRSHVVNFAKSNHRRCSVRKSFLRNFAKFTGKQLCLGLFFNKVAGLRPATLLKKRLWHRCFPANFEIFLRTPFLTEHLRWLLLFRLITEAGSQNVLHKSSENSDQILRKTPVLTSLFNEVADCKHYLWIGTSVTRSMNEAFSRILCFVTNSRQTCFKVCAILGKESSGPSRKNRMC